MAVCTEKRELSISLLIHVKEQYRLITTKIWGTSAGCVWKLEMLLSNQAFPIMSLSRTIHFMIYYAVMLRVDCKSSSVLYKNLIMFTASSLSIWRKEEIGKEGHLIHLPFKIYSSGLSAPNSLYIYISKSKS